MLWLFKVDMHYGQSQIGERRERNPIIMCLCKRINLGINTWHTQHGSTSKCALIAIEKYFRCFRRFNMVSPLKPVLTFPIRSSNANNSWKPSKFELETQYLAQTTSEKWQQNLCIFYLIRHVVDIKPHIPVPIMNIGHPEKDRLIKDHNILIQTVPIECQMIMK